MAVSDFGATYWAVKASSRAADAALAASRQSGALAIGSMAANVDAAMISCIDELEAGHVVPDGGRSAVAFFLMQAMSELADFTERWMRGGFAGGVGADMRLDAVEWCIQRAYERIRPADEGGDEE